MYTAVLKVSGRLHPLSLQCQIDGRCAYLSIVNLSVAANRMLHPNGVKELSGLSSFMNHHQLAVSAFGVE
ncbi:hypothetical protein ACS0PU_001496 [Formica fusca]